jgi:hypothetical protein
MEKENKGIELKKEEEKVRKKINASSNRAESK